MCLIRSADKIGGVGFAVKNLARRKEFKMSHRMRCFAFCLAIIGFMATTADAASRKDSMSMSPATEYVYKQVGDTKLRLYVFSPEDLEKDDSRPAIVFYHGGGWRGGNPRQFAPHCKYLASRGMVAITVEYRLRSTHSVTPKDCVEDAKSAMRWVRSHAEKLCIDPDRIVAGGGSAGGHLAACLSTIDGFNARSDDLSVSCRPQALVLFNPVVRMLPRWHDMLEVEPAEISPADHLKKGLPPTIIFHGTKDTTVPFESIREFCEKMKEHGNLCKVVAFEGMDHAFFNWGKHENKPYVRTIYETDRFLESLDYVQGKPVVSPPIDEP